MRDRKGGGSASARSPVFLARQRGQIHPVKDHRDISHRRRGTMRRPARRSSTRSAWRPTRGCPVDGVPDRARRFTVMPARISAQNSSINSGRSSGRTRRVAAPALSVPDGLHQVPAPGQRFAQLVDRRRRLGALNRQAGFTQRGIFEDGHGRLLCTIEPQNNVYDVCFFVSFLPSLTLAMFELSRICFKAPPLRELLAFVLAECDVAFLIAPFVESGLAICMIFCTACFTTFVHN